MSVWVGEALADGKEAYCSRICKARSLQWESAPLSYIICDPVFPGFSALRNDGVTGAEIAHISWLLSSFTHTDFCPCKHSVEISHSGFTVYLHLSSCVPFIVSTMVFSFCFGLIVITCDLRSSWGCFMALVPLNHHPLTLCPDVHKVSNSEVSRILRSSPPQFWDGIYYLSSKAILLGFTLKHLMKPEPSVSPFIPSLECSKGHTPGSCTIPTSLSLSLSGHPSLLVSSLSPSSALLQGTHVKALSHCLKGLSPPVLHTLRHIWSSVKVGHVNSEQYAYGWGCNMVQWLWKMLDSYLKYKLPIQPSNFFIARNLPKRNESICLHKDKSMNIYASIIHNSFKVESIQMSFNQWMDI